jgi:hypothetical protein
MGWPIAAIHQYNGLFCLDRVKRPLLDCIIKIVFHQKTEYPERMITQYFQVTLKWNQ